MALRKGLASREMDRVLVFTAQPGRIKAVVDVPFERPRSFLQARSDPAFAELVQEIWALLREVFASSPTAPAKRRQASNR